VLLMLDFSFSEFYSFVLAALGMFFAYRCKQKKRHKNKTKNK